MRSGLIPTIRSFAGRLTHLLSSFCSSKQRSLTTRAAGMIPSCPSAKAIVVTNILSAKGSRKPPSTDWSHRGFEFGINHQRGQEGQGLWRKSYIIGRGFGGGGCSCICLFSDGSEKQDTKTGEQTLTSQHCGRTSELGTRLQQNTGACSETLLSRPLHLYAKKSATFWFHFLAMYPSSQSVKLAANSPAQRASTAVSKGAGNRTQQSVTAAPMHPPTSRDATAGAIPTGGGTCTASAPTNNRISSRKNDRRLFEPAGGEESPRTNRSTPSPSTLFLVALSYGRLRAVSNFFLLTRQSQFVLRGDDEARQDRGEGYPPHGDHVGHRPDSVGFLFRRQTTEGKRAHTHATAHTHIQRERQRESCVYCIMPATPDGWSLVNAAKLVK